jgi:hypothetical protein
VNGNLNRPEQRVVPLTGNEEQDAAILQELFDEGWELVNKGAKTAYLRRTVVLEK